MCLRDSSMTSRLAGKVTSILWARSFLTPESLNPKQNSIVQEYILPNFPSNKLGHVRLPGEELSPADQVLHMENERFTIPELLFRPDDIGLFRSPRTIALASLLHPLRSRTIRISHNRGRIYLAPSGGPSRHVLGKYWSDRGQYQLSRILRSIVSSPFMSWLIQQ